MSSYHHGIRYDVGKLESSSHVNGVNGQRHRVVEADAVRFGPPVDGSVAGTSGGGTTSSGVNGGTSGGVTGRACTELGQGDSQSQAGECNL